MASISVDFLDSLVPSSTTNGYTGNEADTSTDSGSSFNSSSSEASSSFENTQTEVKDDTSTDLGFSTDTFNDTDSFYSTFSSDLNNLTAAKSKVQPYSIDTTETVSSLDNIAQETKPYQTAASTTDTSDPLGFVNSDIGSPLMPKPTVEQTNQFEQSRQIVERQAQEQLERDRARKEEDAKYRDDMTRKEAEDLKKRGLWDPVNHYLNLSNPTDEETIEAYNSVINGNKPINDAIVLSVLPGGSVFTSYTANNINKSQGLKQAAKYFSEHPDTDMDTMKLYEKAASGDYKAQRDLLVDKAFGEDGSFNNDFVVGGYGGSLINDIADVQSNPELDDQQKEDIIQTMLSLDPSDLQHQEAIKSAAFNAGLELAGVGLGRILSKIGPSIKGAIVGKVNDVAEKIKVKNISQSLANLKGNGMTIYSKAASVPESTYRELVQRYMTQGFSEYEAIKLANINSHWVELLNQGKLSEIANNEAMRLGKAAYFSTGSTPIREGSAIGGIIDDVVRGAKSTVENNKGKVAAGAAALASGGTVEAMTTNRTKPNSNRLESTTDVFNNASTEPTPTNTTPIKKGSETRYTDPVSASLYNAGTGRGNDSDSLYEAQRYNIENQNGEGFTKSGDAEVSIPKAEDYTSHGILAKIGLTMLTNPGIVGGAGFRDLNNNGRIDWREETNIGKAYTKIVDGLSKTLDTVKSIPDYIKSIPSKVKNTFDINKDGKVSYKDVKNIFTSDEEVHQDSLLKRFGVATKEAFNNKVEQFKNLIDQNSNGKFDFNDVVTGIKVVANNLMDLVFPDMDDLDKKYLATDMVVGSIVSGNPLPMQKINDEIIENQIEVLDTVIGIWSDGEKRLSQDEKRVIYQLSRFGLGIADDPVNTARRSIGRTKGILVNAQTRDRASGNPKGSIPFESKIATDSVAPTSHMGYGFTTTENDMDPKDYKLRDFYTGNTTSSSGNEDYNEGLDLDSLGEAAKNWFKNKSYASKVRSLYDNYSR